MCCIDGPSMFTKSSCSVRGEAEDFVDITFILIAGEEIASRCPELRLLLNETLGLGGFIHAPFTFSIP